MNTQTATEISDEIRPMTSAELDTISGGKLLHASFTLGCTKYTIIAGGVYGYSIIKDAWGDCRY